MQVLGEPCPTCEAAASRSAALDVPRLARVIRELTDEHGWPTSSVGFDNFMAAIEIEYARLASEAK